MSRNILRSVLYLAVTLLFIGCSGGGGSGDPTSPNVGDTEMGLTRQSNSTENHYLWMYRFIQMDPQSLEYEIFEPKGIAGHWNVLIWLEGAPCTNCLKINSITPSGNGTLLVEVQVTHPFPNLNFTGFDVRGIA